MSETDPIIDDAYAFLRSRFTAELRFDENVRDVKYVHHSDGRLVLPAMVAMLRSFDTVLFIPSYEDGSMEVQVTFEEFQETGKDGIAADRWRIYHGEPPDVRWCFAKIDMARYQEMVIDGDALMRANPLANDEAALCKRFNAPDQMAGLKVLCAKLGAMEVESPLMVGIDPTGIDIRARFDVVRIPSTQPMPTADEATKVLQSMIKTAVG